MRFDVIHFLGRHCANTARAFERLSARLRRLRRAMIGATLLAGAPAHPCVAADLALGEYLSGECVGCHQLSGKVAGGIPSIVGIPEGSLAAALFAYKNGMRENPVMRNIAGRLSEEEIAALAAFFANQKQ